MTVPKARFRLEILLLVVAALCFGLDLYHFSHHLGHDPGLIDLEGVRLKIAWKAFWFLGTLALLIFSKRLRFLGIVILMTGFGGFEAWARPGNEVCERAREFMQESGMARDAKENFLGRLKITPPRSSFPPEMDKVSWWGTFKPFEFWQSPEFEAVWINPEGLAVNRSSFRGGHCQLAKTTLKVNELPQRRLEPGMWRVIISCGDVVIDNHPFAVIGSTPSSGEGRDAKDSGVMIWADDVK